jgi:hypothetical protein
MKGRRKWWTCVEDIVVGPQSGSDHAVWASAASVGLLTQLAKRLRLRRRGD